MWATIPVKSFTDAKRRLAPVLSPPERRLYARIMFGQVLSTVLRVRQLAGILVVTRDPGAARLARKMGAKVVHDGEERGHTDAVRRATAALALRGIDDMIVLPGDVPLASVEEIEEVIAAHARPSAVTIVPSRDHLGSNCIAASPANAIPFAFGEGSFARHLDAARSRGIEPRVLELSGLQLDIDTPEDLRLLLERREPGRARDFLVERGIAARLAALKSPANGKRASDHKAVSTDETRS